MIAYEWRGPFASPEVGALHGEAFGSLGGPDWRAQVERHSLGWVCARDDGNLAGFVNLAWDGGAHAFILDTMVDPGFQRLGIGRDLVRTVTDEAFTAGCDWVHVDYEPEYASFYENACGFRPTAAGLRPAPQA